MLEIAALLTAECALLVAAAVLREPKLLILCVIAGLPIEYFGTETLGTLGQGGIMGAVRALLNPGKLAMLATIVVGAWRLRHEPQRLIPNSAILLPITALLAFFLLGVGWSDSLRPTNAILIMPMYVAFVFVAPSLIEDRRDLERIAGMFLLVCALLALLAIAQRLTGVFNWRAILIQSDGYSYRSNATFSDPNHLARYLGITMALAAGLILATGPRRQTVYLAIPALAFGFAAIVATGSRSGWAMMVIVIGLMVLLAPIARYTKAKLVLSASGALALMITLLMIQGGENAARVRSLADPVTALGQRDFLIRAGWQMFLDHPWIGVGSGNYQHTLIVSYKYLLPWWAEVTLSHTSMVSLLAESGVIGVALFLFVCVRITAAMTRTYFRAKARYSRLMVGWLAAGLVGIFLQSQSEGRLFDEPYLWLLLAIFVALETRPKLLGEQTGAAEAAAPARQAVSVRPACGGRKPALEVPVTQSTTEDGAAGA